MSRAPAIGRALHTRPAVSICQHCRQHLSAFVSIHQQTGTHCKIEGIQNDFENGLAWHLHALGDRMVFEVRREVPHAQPPVLCHRPANQQSPSVYFASQRALPTETKVESGTSQSTSGTSVNLRMAWVTNDLNGKSPEAGGERNRRGISSLLRSPCLHQVLLVYRAGHTGVPRS